MQAIPKIIAVKQVSQGKFLTFNKIHWRDAHEVDREWESADRREGFAAVMIIARQVPSGRIVLIKQFRPPARSWVVEFPAGILEEDENPLEGALRELREETGFIGSNVRLHPAAMTSPGMTNEAVHIAEIDIDETDPQNANPKTDFDPSEMIETLLVLPGELRDYYCRETARNVRFDSKLAAYILALSNSEGMLLA